MTVLILFMFVPQWCCFYTREPEKNNRRIVSDGGKAKSTQVDEPAGKPAAEKKKE